MSLVTTNIDIVPQTELQMISVINDAPIRATAMLLLLIAGR
jgi:hypothetical protein